MIRSNPRSGIVTGRLAVPVRTFGQSIHPIALTGSDPVCPPAIPSTSTMLGQAKALDVLSRLPGMYPSRSRIGAHPSIGTFAPPAYPVIVYDGITYPRLS